MTNLVITNDAPDGAPVLRVTRNDGEVVDLQPGSCRGFDPDPSFSYTMQWILQPGE